MDIERETVYQLGLAGGAVALFIAAVVFVGTSYGTAASGDGIKHLTPEGGIALVGAIGLFVVLMLFAGLFLERQEF